MRESAQYEVKTARPALLDSYRRMLGRLPAGDIHERRAAFAQMIAASLAQPSSNVESEIYATLVRAHYLLSTEVGEEALNSHNYVIVHLRDHLIDVACFDTEYEYDEAQDAVAEGGLPQPSRH